MLKMTSGIAFAAALVAAAVPALAGPRDRAPAETMEFTRPAGAADPDAAGTVTVKSGGRGDKVVVKVRNLEPRTDYEVRDAGSDAVLGTLRTNGRGRGSLKLAEAGPGKRVEFEGVNGLEVADEETGEGVLECDVELGDPADGGNGEWSFAFGYGDYENDAGDVAFVSMASAVTPEYESESFSVFLYPAAGDDWWSSTWYELYLDTFNGDELPLGVEGVAELAGRAFEIRDADGGVAIAGDLPELESYDDIFRPADEGGGNGGVFGGLPGTRKTERETPDGNEEPTDPASGYTLFIENDDGNFEEAGDLVEIVFEEPPYEDPCCCCNCCCDCWCHYEDGYEEWIPDDGEGHGEDEGENALPFGTR